jgi:hypothetical protein
MEKIQGNSLSSYFEQKCHLFNKEIKRVEKILPGGRDCYQREGRRCEERV